MINFRLKKTQLLIFILLLVACGASSQDVALHQAVRDNDPQAVEQLLADGADINAPETAATTALDTDSTAIIIAAGKQYVEIVDILIANGADVNATSIYGATALSETAIKGNNEIITLLLSAGADVNTTNKWGKTPLMWAADYGMVDAVILLLAEGADPSLVDEDGMSALDFAMESEYGEVVKLLE